MRRDEQTHDSTVIEAVFILVACGTPLAGFALLEAGVAWIFGLDAPIWRHVGVALFCVAATVALGTATMLNRDHRERSRS